MVVTPPNTGPQPQPGILDIAAYIPGKSGAKGQKIHKLSSNESPLGPSPQAIKAYIECAQNLHSYPDGSATDLRHAIAGHYGLNADHIVCGTGSDELLELLARAYLGPGDEAIYAEYGFLVYPIAIQASGATPVIAPETDFTATADGFLNKVNERTKIVFLANPNNPTGTYMPFNEVKRLHAGLPESCLLVLDAAYAEYIKNNDYEAGVELVSSTNNVVMTRTFSKAFGLAALRLGWAYCPPAIADVLNRIRGPFNVNMPAIAAGVAAIHDTAHIAATIALNDEWQPKVTVALRNIGLTVTNSTGNFILVHFPTDDKHSAHQADTWLIEHNIVVRRMDAYALPNALRISIGIPQANQDLIAALTAFMANTD